MSKSKAPRLLRIHGRTHYALVRIHIGRKSVIKAQLRKGKRVVGTKRVEHSKAGTYEVKVNLSKTWLRRYRQRGLKRVTFTLRIVVAGSNGATKVYSPRAYLDVSLEGLGSLLRRAIGGSWPGLCRRRWL